MSDRIAVMNEGRIEQCADPEQVYEKPATTFVAGFIGVSNLLPAVVGGGDEVSIIDGPTVPTPDASRFPSGENLFAVVRPEKLDVSNPGEGPADRPGIEGIVESSLFLGTATQLGVKVADDSKLTVLVPNASEEERHRLPGGGARVHLSWEPEHMHLVTESPNGAGATSSSTNQPEGETTQ